MQHVMIESPRLEKEKIIKDVRYLFRLEKENEEIKDRILWDIRNIFRLQKENKAIKDIILRNTRKSKLFLITKKNKIIIKQ